MDAARIGLITDDDFNRHTLHNLLNEAGYNVNVMLDPERLERFFTNQLDEKNQVDTWVLDLINSDAEPVLEQLFEHTQQALLINDEIPAVQNHDAHQYWAKRLLEKLEVLAIASDDHSSLPEAKLSESIQARTKAYAERVWVLAASLGGPDAVKRFLQNLAPDLPIAMVYVQHIEESFDKVLTDSMAKDLHYQLHLARGQQLLVEGEVTMVPADRQVKFLPFGKVVELQKPWEGAYQPTIDQVIAELARIYRDKLGVIIFSGMCNDGEIGCRVVKANGGLVWAQTQESCASDEMVKSAVATGCVTEQGTPEQLAQKLSQFVGAES